MKHHLLTASIFFIITVSAIANINPVRLTFDHFPYVDKLPSNSIMRLYHDKQGYMWFGSRDGLCRFDGYDVKVFRSSSSNPDLLTNNYIQCLAEDLHSRLWIGTMEGINILDKKNYSIKPLDHPIIGRDRIVSLCIDKAGNVWVGTFSNGIVRIAPDGKTFHYQSNPSRRGAVPGNNVTSIYQDKQGRIWALFLKKGVALYQEKSDSFKTFPPIGAGNNPFRIMQDKDNNLWVCTWGDGLFSMDMSALPRNPFTPVTYLKNGKPAKVNNIIYSMVQDSRYGHIWAITFSGLCVLEKMDSKTFNLIDSESMFTESYSKLFHEIIEDRQGNLWLGSVGDGIFRLDFNKPALQTNALPAIRTSLGFPPTVTRFCETVDGDIYLVINRSGLYTLNPRTGAITRPPNPAVREIQSIIDIKRMKRSQQIWFSREGRHEIYVMDDRKGGSNELKVIPIESKNKDFSITCFYEDAYGDAWIGTDIGLYKKALGGKISLVSSKIKNITVISADQNGNVWVGSDKLGVFKLSGCVGKQTCTKIFTYNKQTGNIRSNSIQSICCRKNGEVCIGTREGSIYLYKEQTNEMSDVSRLYGITEESVMNILEDNLGALWISTVKKIIKFYPDSHVTTYYTQNDGILVSSFAKDACVKLQNGQMMFGGNKGICMFTPEHLEKKISSPQKVVITNIDVQNQSIFGTETDRHFKVEENRLTLRHNEDNLSLEFSALNYSASDKIQYAYKLSGIDKDWIYVGNKRRFVNYANLPTGRYTFQVKASDETGSWSNQITSLDVVKQPPLYKSWWAYLIYLILLGVSVYIVYNRIRLKNALKIARIEQEKSEELAQTKLRYFTNISHDLLTPLTIISLLTEELRNKHREDQTQVELISSNVVRLRRLIKQILAFRKVESGNMTLKVQQADVVAFVREVCYTNFQPLIKEKEINFSIKSEYEHHPAYFDTDKLDKVLYNLLSNAFKFTPSGGSISVKIAFPVLEGVPSLRLAVSDTGVGIDEKDISHIFTRFYASNQSDQSQSNGIGLSLSRDLLQIHKGDIRLESRVGEGSIFTFEIPVSKRAYSDDEIAVVESVVEIQSGGEQPGPDVVIGQDSAKEASIRGNYNVLVVEDNRELKNIIVDSLTKEYCVWSAENGVQALDLINEKDFDLVISDVMMPEMDGLTLCQRIKSDISTSHIDVLLLTAKISSEDQVDYYNAGADAYIPKPFDLKVLEARVKNLIGKRKQKTDQFRENKEVNISSMQYSSLDEEFLKKAVEIVEARMSEFTFDYDEFALEMSSSKSTLHRKLKSLTDMSPGEFIRNVRLKHACQMLLKTEDPISEIAYAVGFNNPKYFSSCFKNEFGITPREYRDAQSFPSAQFV